MGRPNSNLTGVLIRENLNTKRDTRDAQAEARPYEDTARRQLSASQVEASKENQSANTLILDLQPLELRENKFLLSYLVCGILLWQL